MQQFVLYKALHFNSGSPGLGRHGPYSYILCTPHFKHQTKRLHPRRDPPSLHSSPTPPGSGQVFALSTERIRLACLSQALLCCRCWKNSIRSSPSRQLQKSPKRSLMTMSPRFRPSTLVALKTGPDGNALFDDGVTLEPPHTLIKGKCNLLAEHHWRPRLRPYSAIMEFHPYLTTHLCSMSTDR